MASPGLTAPARPKRVLHARVTEQQHAVLHRLAAELDATVSGIARLALARGLELIEAEQRRA